MKKLLISISFAGLLFSCNTSSDSKNQPCDTVYVDRPGVHAAALPDNSFYCLRAGKDTIEAWLELQGPANKYKRIVFNYYWPDRTQNGFTLMGIRSTDKGNPQRFDPTRWILKQTAVCGVQGIGNSIILADQQVSVETIRKIWSYREGNGSDNYLKFTPMVNAGEEPMGNTCNCPNHLVYKIELILKNGLPPGGDYAPGSTNPSPPKPPAD